MTKIITVDRRCVVFSTSVCCCSLCFVAAIVFAGVFGWSYNNWQISQRTNDALCSDYVNTLEWSGDCDHTVRLCWYPSQGIRYENVDVDDECHEYYLKRFSTQGRRLQNGPTAQPTVQPTAISTPTPSSTSACNGDVLPELQSLGTALTTLEERILTAAADTPTSVPTLPGVAPIQNELYEEMHSAAPTSPTPTAAPTTSVPTTIPTNCDCIAACDTFDNFQNRVQKMIKEMSDLDNVLQSKAWGGTPRNLITQAPTPMLY